MTVIAVVNRKGGSGKSTLATHLAAYVASLGEDVMLGDVDRLQSSRLWLSLRDTDKPKIHGWSIDEDKFARPPAGVRQVILDTPGGFHGFTLMKVSMHADAILIPITPGVFDRAAATESIKELRGFPRLATGRCQLACVGMRIDRRTSQAAELADWAKEMDIPLLGCIRMAQVYPRCMEEGLTIFDVPPNQAEAHLFDWVGVKRWVNAILHAAPAAPGSPLSTAERASGSRVLKTGMSYPILRSTAA